MHAYIHTHACIDTYIQNDALEMWSLFIFLMPGYLGEQVHANIQTCMHACMYTRTHTCIDTCIHAYTDGVYTKGTRAHTHREPIREWLWEPKGAPWNISRCLGGGVDAATLVAALAPARRPLFTSVVDYEIPRKENSSICRVYP